MTIMKNVKHDNHVYLSLIVSNRKVEEDQQLHDVVDRLYIRVYPPALTLKCASYFSHQGLLEPRIFKKSTFPYKTSTISVSQP